MSEEIKSKEKGKEIVDDLKQAGQSIVDAQLVDEYEDESQIDYPKIIKRFQFIKGFSIASLIMFFLVFIPILIAWFLLEVNVDDPNVTLQQKQNFGGITIGLIISAVIVVVFEVVQFFNKLWAIKIKKVHPKLETLIQFKYSIVVFILIGSVSLLVYSNKSILILRNYLKKLAKDKENENNKETRDESKPTGENNTQQIEVKEETKSESTSLNSEVDNQNTKNFDEPKNSENQDEI